MDKEDNLLCSWTSSSKLRFHIILSVWSLTLFGLPQIGSFEALEVVYEMEARKILIFGFKYFSFFFFFFWVSCIIGLPLTWYVNWGWLWTKNKKEYFYVCGCFASVCAPHANLVSSKARRGYVVPWVAWVLGRELRSSVAFFITKPSLLPASELWSSFTFQLLGSTVWSAHKIVCSARNGTQARLQGTPEKNFIKSQQPFNGVSFGGDIVRIFENSWSCLCYEIRVREIKMWLKFNFI